MARKLRIFAAVLTILVLSSTFGIAEDIAADGSYAVAGNFFVKKICINGVDVNNYNLQYPFVTMQNTLYMPLTETISELCGVEAELDEESKTLILKKREPSKAALPAWAKNNGEDTPLTALTGYTVRAINTELLSGGNLLSLVTSALGDGGLAGAVRLAGSASERLDLGDSVLLKMGKYVYIPVRLLEQSEIFAWDVDFDSYWGVAMATDGKSAAAGYIDQNEAVYYYKLANYIMAENRAITPALAQEYVFLFLRAGEVYGVDPKLVMAVADKESHFTADAGAGKGNIAKGIMQIMPDTGLRMGFTEAMLLDARTSINLGAKLIAGQTEVFGGDFIKGLSAYNFGSGNVKRGTYNTKYANMVLAEYYELVAYAMG